jgi:hypothetical protein
LRKFLLRKKKTKLELEELSSIRKKQLSYSKNRKLKKKGGDLKLRNRIGLEKNKLKITLIKKENSNG